MTRIVLGVVIQLIMLHRVTSQEAREAQLERLGNITERLESYQRCMQDSDCPANNSFCFNNDNTRVGQCKCMLGFEMLQRNRTFYSCLKLATVGEECQIDEQCIDNLGAWAKCDGVCGCQEGSIRYSQDGRCHKTMLLEDFCRTDGNCVLEDGTAAYCTDGQCQCNIGLRPSLDRKRCVVARNLGQTCENDYECSFIESASCRDVCRCSMGFAISRNQTTCLKAATYFGEPCEEDGQCSEFLHDSICSQGNCTCQDNYHGYENKCVRSASIGEVCTSVEECLPNDKYRDIADCVEGVCQCLPGAVNPDGLLDCSHSSTFYPNFTLMLSFVVFVRAFNLL